MLELLYQSTKTFTLGTAYSPEVIYLASVDAVLYVAPALTGALRKVFRDGTFFELESRAAFAGYFLSAVEGRGAATINNADHIVDVAMLDEISCLPVLREPLNGVDFAGKVALGSVVDHVNGLVYTPGAKVLIDGMYCQEVKIYALATGVLQDTLNVPLSTANDWNYLLARLHAADASNLLLSTDNNRIVIFDRLTGGMVFKGLISGNRRGVAYDTTHNVIISLLNSGQVAVHALNNVGANLAAPAFLTPPALFTLSRVRTRLTTDDGQGVAGATVLWWLAGGKGYLEQPYSLTDGNGYAYNWYYGPESSAGLGQETVNVEVTV